MNFVDKDGTIKLHMAYPPLAVQVLMEEFLLKKKTGVYFQMM